MSDLFMDMQRQRRWRRATAPGRTASNSSSATTTRSAPSCRSLAASADAHAAADAAAEPDADGYENLLSLQLRKPHHWNWELSTSRSCSNIALPRILLYDHKGALLADVNSQAEQCIRPAALRRQRTGSSGAHSAATATSVRQPRDSSRAASANLAQSIRRALDRDFDELQIVEAKSPCPNSRASTANANSPVDFYSNDLPDYRSAHSRSSSLKGVRFHVVDTRASRDSSAASRLAAYSLTDLPTPPSTATPTTTTTNSSASGPREKRRYRRSRSSGRTAPAPNSILERLSYTRGRFSSPETETAETYELPQSPRYYLRSSKAGTLMLRDESFSHCRRRRRKQKTSSSETLPNEGVGGGSGGGGGSAQCRSRSTSQLRVLDPFMTTELGGGSLQDISELPERGRERTLSVRRYRSDGSVLLHTPSTSEAEEEERPHGYHQQQQQHQRQYNGRGHSKRDLPTIDSGNEVATHHVWDRRPTRR